MSGAPPVGSVWDFTYDGIMKSVEESFRRTVGIRSIDELEKDLRWLDVSIPDELWAELKHEGLLREDVPTPRSARVESPHK